MTRSHKSKSSHYKRPRPNTGRTQWNSDAFISPPKVDDGELSVRMEDVYDFQVDFMDDFTDAHGTHRHQTDMMISLLDIARPAKRKGITKDFEVVRKVRNVIALEDDLEGLDYLWEDDEWEQVYDESRAERSRSYSSVLRGNET